MDRKYLEAAITGTIREHLSRLEGLLMRESDPDDVSLYITDIVDALRSGGLDKALGNLAESFTLGEENRIGVRAVIAAHQIPADPDKPIVIKLEAANNNLTGVQLAMLRGEAVDLTGCQGELFAASDLGIHLAPEMDLFQDAV